MANDRMFLRCKECNELFGLGVHSFGMYWLRGDLEKFGSDLMEFYEKHKCCGKIEKYGEKIQPFNLVYESDFYKIRKPFEYFIPERFADGSE